MATQEGITGWSDEEAGVAAAKCFKQWLEARGGAGILEETKIINQVRSYFEQFGESRFVSCRLMGNQIRRKMLDSSVPIRTGIRVEDETGSKSCFYVFPETFRENICAGYNSTMVANLLAERGLLRRSPEGKNQCTKSIPGIGAKKIYHITEDILSDPEQPGTP